MTKSIRFWNRHAEGYAKSPVADEASYQHKLALTRQYMRPDMDVLELGCGTGSTAILHAPFVHHIHAVDYSSKMIEIAKNKAADANVENISFSVSSLEELEVPDNSQSMVMTMSLLHLLEDLDEGLRKVHAMLKPGGIFVSSTTCLSDLNFFLRALLRGVAGPANWIGLAPSLLYFTSAELLVRLQRADFRIDQQWQPDRHKALFIAAVKR